MTDIYPEGKERPVPEAEMSKAWAWIRGSRTFEGEGGTDRVTLMAAHNVLRIRFNQELANSPRMDPADRVAMLIDPTMDRSIDPNPGWESATRPILKRDQPRRLG